MGSRRSNGRKWALRGTGPLAGTWVRDADSMGTRDEMKLFKRAQDAKSFRSLHFGRADHNLEIVPIFFSIRRWYHWFAY